MKGIFNSKSGRYFVLFDKILAKIWPENFQGTDSYCILEAICLAPCWYYVTDHFPFSGSSFMFLNNDMGLIQGFCLYCAMECTQILRNLYHNLMKNCKSRQLQPASGSARGCVGDSWPRIKNNIVVTLPGIKVKTEYLFRSNRTR